MRKYPRIVQADGRGQLVIPKEVRNALSIEDGTGFFVYVIENEGIMLKLIKEPDLENEEIVHTIGKNTQKIGIQKSKLKKSVASYKRKKKGGLDII